MRFRITVDVEVRHDSGPFASREELSALLLEAIEDANPGMLDTDNDAVYEVAEFAAEVTKP